MNNTNLNKVPRIDVADALRGLAIMAILLIHCVEHFIYPVYPDTLAQPAWLNAIDSITFNTTFSLIAGKGYSIFALLFGFTFYVQYTNQQNKGADFRWRFVWRLILLAFFATINAAFFPGGDVLMLFVFTGISLVLVCRMSNKTILIIAVVCLMQPIELLHFVYSCFDKSHTLPQLNVGALYKEVQAGVQSGNWNNFFLKNITTGQKASLMWAVGCGRFVQTIGLFLTGFLLSRNNYFVKSDQNNRFWVKLLIISAIAFAILYPLKVQWYDNSATPIIKDTIGTVLDMWQKLSLTIVIVSSFILAYYNTNFEKWTAKLRIYGKMSLTNYVAQSIIGALLFFPVGLNLAPYLGYTASLILGIFIFIVQLHICNIWYKKHKQGPLEKLWHSATWIGNK
ncbi:MAG: DUF418 domain-containing protein [Bacteroidales bacterium]